MHKLVTVYLILASYNLVASQRCIAYNAIDLSRPFQVMHLGQASCNLLPTYSDLANNDNVGCGITPLMQAAMLGQEDGVKYLLEYRRNDERIVDINACDVNRWTALMHAASKGHCGIIAMLLEHGADLYAQCTQGDDALDLAFRYLQKESAKLIGQAMLKDLSNKDLSNKKPMGSTIYPSATEVELWFKDPLANFLDYALPIDQNFVSQTNNYDGETTNSGKPTAIFNSDHQESPGSPYVSSDSENIFCGENFDDFFKPID